MNKTQKLEYQQQIEKYLEEHQVYDMFEYLMKGILKEKPKDPISFMISKLENPERMILSETFTILVQKNTHPRISKTHIRNGTTRLP